MSTTSNARTAAIIGAGQIGVTAALGLLDAGFEVTIYSERDQQTLRNGVPPTGTVLILGEPLAAEATLGLDSYLGRAPHHTGLTARVVGPDGSPALQFDSAFAGFVGVGVDIRLKADDRLTLFQQRGGRFVVDKVDADKLDSIAATSDFTLVSTGRGGLADLFAIDNARTPYDAPQRTVINVIATGLTHGPEVFSNRSPAGGTRSAFTIVSDQGEGWWGPFLHKDVGPSWSFIGWAKPGSDWERRISAADSADSALQIVLEFYRDHAPWDLPELLQLRSIADIDPFSWSKGAVRPVVRAGSAVTASGHAVASLGDTSAAFDPISGQGAQTGLLQTRRLISAAAKHDGPFDTAWIDRQYAEHLATRTDGAVKFQQLFLGDPELAYINEPFFAAAAVSPVFASAIGGLINNPQPLLDINNPGDVLDYIRAVTGVDPEQLLATFVPPTGFTTSPLTPSVIS
ncbi:MAG: styrene monooxygenase/indole monooxygenase family protein [Rhodococcus sp. (in: high G+C Gram-positive bacteria)]